MSRSIFVISLPLLLLVAACDVVYQDADGERWQDRLPYAMNGCRPQGFRYLGRHRAELIENRWHGYHFDAPNYSKGWKPEDFFSDEQSIALIQAIIARDVALMQRLIADGAKVNEQGVGGMNALYWAWYIDDDPRPFECLIDHGANPNLLVTEGAAGKPGLMPGSNAVVHLVSKHGYNRLFERVFENGGDPNLFNYFLDPYTPFLGLSTNAVDGMERLELLLKCGADVDQRRYQGGTMLFSLVSVPSSVRLEMALRLLEHGADYELEYWHALGRWRPEWRGCHFRLIHVLAVMQVRIDAMGDETKVKFREIVKYFEDAGESLESANEELKRWRAWIDNGKQSLIEKEWAERTSKAIDEAKGNDEEMKRWPRMLFEYVTRPSEARLQMALKLVEAGATIDHEYEQEVTLYLPKWRGCRFRLVHVLAIIERWKKEERPAILKRTKAYGRLSRLIEKQGESLVDAEADLARWEKWIDENRFDLIEQEQNESMQLKEGKSR